LFEPLNSNIVQIGMRLISTLLLAFFMQSLNAQVSADSVKSEVVVEPCTDPHFPGGNAELNKFMNSILVYPGIDEGIQGKVYVSFTIDSTGKLLDPKVKRGINYDFDKEAMRIVRLMPDWIPGKCNGIQQKTGMINPITFKLQ
jgi:TonB family protein